ncbi:MAG: hypothetical protein ACI909_001326 [Planctomycetota bacterium]|jgi:hypothetical protein
MQNTSGKDTAKFAINQLIRSDIQTQKLDAGLELQRIALDVINRPKMRQRFAQAALLALANEFIKFSNGRSRQIRVLKQNLEVMGLLGRDALPQLNVLIRTWIKLIEKNSSSKQALQQDIEHAFERIYDDSFSYIQNIIHKPNLNVQKRTDAIKHLGAFLHFWAVLNYNDKICKKIVAELIFVTENDPSSLVIAESINALAYLEESVILADDRQRFKLVLCLIRKLNDKRHAQYRGRRALLRNTINRQLRKFQYGMHNNLDRLLRFYIKETELFATAENRIDFFKYFNGVIRSVIKSPGGHRLKRKYVASVTNRLERMKHQESEKKVRLQLSRARSNLLKLL